MKKIITALTGMVMAVALFIQGAGVGNQALAADLKTIPVKQSQFVAGIHGNNCNGDEIVVALYDTGTQDVAYISDGKTSFYDEYTVKDTTVKSASFAQRFNIGGVTFTYCEINGGQYILTDEGDVYVVEDITAYEAEQIRK